MSVAPWRFVTPASGLREVAAKGLAARLYGLNVKAALGEITGDRIAAIRSEYFAMGGTRTNARPARGAGSHVAGAALHLGSRLGARPWAPTFSV
jgi:hypothetical protein